MRHIVYLWLGICGVGPATAADLLAAGPVPIDGQRSAAKLDLDPIPARAESRPTSSPSARPRPVNLSAAITEDVRRPRALGERGEIAVALPSGLDLRAAGAFSAKDLFNQAAWPTGGRVPSVKAVASIGTTVARGDRGPTRLDLSVTRNWQLDAPIGGTYLDCNLRLALSSAAASSVAVQVPCGSEGRFVLAVRQNF